MASNIGLRLKQVPVDQWSIREKLSLASSVLRSGDQNWYSVSRSLKAFGEPNRPADWFSQKNCALQYSELLENVETPKRKRGERGENTAEDLIVRELTCKRKEELEKLIAEEKETCDALQIEIDLLNSGEITEEKLKELDDRMTKAKEDIEREKEEHRQWLIDREKKIAQAKATRHGLFSFHRSPRPSKLSVSSTSLEADSIKDNSTQPLTVKVENSVSTPASKESSVDEKVIQTPVTPVSASASTPSTSPLLTSLLQSPSPSTPSPANFSPAGNLKELINRPPPSTSASAFFFNSSVTTTAQPKTSTSIVLSPTASSPSISADKSKEQESSPAVPSASPALSKLLETPSTPIKSSEAADIQKKDYPEKDMKMATETINEIQTDTHELKESPRHVDELGAQESQESSDSMESSSQTKVSNVSSSASISSTDVEMPLVSSSTAADASLDMIVSVEKSSDASTPIEIKQEIVDSRENSAKSPDESSKRRNDVKKEVEDSNFSDDGKNLDNIAGADTQRKRKRSAVMAVATPTSTPSNKRRSNRVRAIRDSKEGFEDSPEKPEKPLSTPASDGGKKFSLSTIPLTPSANAADSLLSDDSLRLKSSTRASSVSESTPNSPASSIMQGNEDPESIKEYKLWKKSIMLLWRQAATHKYSTLFSHPVTDNDAKGYLTVVYRPMDLATIRKRIESGSIRTTTEFHRDIMLMFQNAIMYNSYKHDVHQMAVEMQKEILECIEAFIDTQQQSQPAVEVKPRGRRSLATSGSQNSTPTVEPQDESSIANRKKRRNSTDTDPGSTKKSGKSRR